jgi:hypothetical protein
MAAMETIMVVIDNYVNAVALDSIQAAHSGVLWQLD